MANPNDKIFQEMNNKLNTVVDFSQEALNQGDVIRDLVRDLNIVNNSAMHSLQKELELANVHVDGREVRELFILFLKNIHNINAALQQMEAFTELGRETTITGQNLIKDLIERAEELERKGYFEHGQKAVRAVDKFLENLPQETFERLETAAPELARLTAELSDPGQISGCRKMIQKRKFLVPAAIAAWLIPVGLLVAILFV